MIQIHQTERLDSYRHVVLALELRIEKNEFVSNHFMLRPYPPASSSRDPLSTICKKSAFFCTDGFAFYSGKWVSVRATQL